MNLHIYFTSSMTSSFDFANGKKLLQKTKIYEIPVIVLSTLVPIFNDIIYTSIINFCIKTKNLMVFKNYFNVN